jgi:hypothetical protein
MKKVSEKKFYSQVSKAIIAADNRQGKKRLRCCCCSSEFTGREWATQNRGFGICAECLEKICDEETEELLNLK